MHSKMMQWSRGLFLAGIVLALVLVIPAAWFPFELAKITVFAICALASALLFVAGGGVGEFVRSHGRRGVLMVALLPLAYVLSFAFSLDKSVGLTGFAFEVDTVVFAALAFVAYVMGFVHFRTLRTAKLLITVVGGALALAAVFQVVSIVSGGAAIPFAAFADRSANLVGKWNDLGLMLGLLLLGLLTATQFTQMSGRMRGVSAAVMALLAVVLALINFGLVWGLVCIGALAVALVSFLSARGAANEQGSTAGMRGTLPVLPLVCAVVAGGFLLWGSVANLAVSNVFPVSSLEVRPSYQTTMAVINTVRGNSPARLLTGVGPNTFGEMWLAAKPAEVNQSQFWNLDFNVGYSTALTAFGTTGLLGVLGWLMPVLLILAGLLRAVRLRLIGPADRATAVSLTIAGLFMAGAVVFYVPSANLLLVGMALSGAAFGFLWRQGRSAEDAAPGRMAYIGSLVVVLALVGLSAWASAVSVRRVAAEAYVGRAAAALSAGETDKAIAFAATARSIEQTGDTLRSAATAGFAKLQALSQDTQTPPATLQEQFASTVQDTLSAAALAQAKNPADYRPVLLLAQVYDFLAQLKVEGAAVQGRAAYIAAAEKNPTNPQISLLRARLEAVAGDAAEMQKQLQQALTLKPNYTDAMLFVVQLAIANNDLQTAVTAVEAAVQSAPGIPSLWFEYGLLLYSGNATAEAIPALERAITLQADYANAKYFLGLAYYAEQRTAEAVRQFEDLAASNPDNAEVKAVLANMRAGKPAFEGATPPADVPPEERDTAPINQ